MHYVHTLSAQQHASEHGLDQGLRRVLSIFLLTKVQRIRNKITVIREESPLKWRKLITIMYTPTPACSGVYLSQLNALVQSSMHVH